MTEFEREEAAFRTAFQRQVSEAPVEIPEPGRRRGWVPQLLVAALVLAVVGGTYAVLRDEDSSKVHPAAVGTSYWDSHDWRWIGIRDVELKAPAGWDAAFEVGRPDCFHLGTDDPADPAEFGVSTVPYVVLGDPNAVVTTQGCLPKKSDDDPDPAFGQLPFPLWQPYVKVETARPDLAEQQPAYRDAEKTFRGWRLTRTTTNDVQISVLSAPGNDGLAAAVLGSVRQITVNDIGCPATSGILDLTARMDLDSPPAPAPDDVTAVAICDYTNDDDKGWLRGSRRISGEDAQTLVQEIQQSPTGVGPESPGTCSIQRPLDRALMLRIYSEGGSGEEPTSDAYVFFDSCEDNGIVEPGGVHPLTPETCTPLFAEPPIGIFSAGGVVLPLCNPAAR